MNLSASIYKEGNMAQPTTIRSATVEDVPALAELHVRSWQWAYRGLIPDEYLDGMSATLEQRIEQRRTQLASLPPETRWWVAEQHSRIVGFAITGLSRDQDVPPETVEVYAIYLAQDAAGQGIGRTLFAHAVSDLCQRGFERAILWVLTGNQRARRFYEAAGWTPDGTSKTDERPGTLLHEVRYHVALNT